MKSKYALILFWMLFSTSLVNVSFAAENAFGSLITTNTAATNTGSSSNMIVDVAVHPLLRYPVESVTLMGLMVSPTLKVAIIRLQDGNEYFIRLGDRLGDASGTVTDIKSSSIEVTEAGEIVSVEVRNRSVNDENDQ